MYSSSSKSSPPHSFHGSRSGSGSASGAMDSGFSLTTHRSTNSRSSPAIQNHPTHAHIGGATDHHAHSHTHTHAHANAHNSLTHNSHSHSNQSSSAVTLPLLSHSSSSSSTSSSVSQSAASSLSSLLGMKRARLLYSSDSPRGKKKGLSWWTAFIESRYAQPVYVFSLILNILLVIILISTLITDRSPWCFLTNDNPEQTVDPDPVSPRPNKLTPIQVDPPTQTDPEAVLEEPEVPDIDPENTDKPAVIPQPPSPNPVIVPPSPPPVDKPSTNTDATMFADELSDHDYNKDAHAITWSYCLPSAGNHLQTIPEDQLLNYSSLVPTSYCPPVAIVEQSWQIGWYGGQVAVGGGPERSFPLAQQCIHLPPEDYIWPTKYTPLPAHDQSFLHWPNLRVHRYEDLKIFNQGTPKNLYHFNAPQYDLDGLDELSLAAKYIPFAQKIRNFLDIGAGGGSLGLLLKRKYNVQAMSIIFPDWPYCEYITERGGMCVLVDVMEAMPFAHYSFDAVHISWVYHGQQPAELLQMYTEIDRIMRPGGYLWQRGGWAMVQINAQKALFEKLGYVSLYEHLTVKPAGITTFGENLPFEGEWSCIYVKPIHAVKKEDCTTAPDIQ